MNVLSISRRFMWLAILVAVYSVICPLKAQQSDVPRSNGAPKPVNRGAQTKSKLDVYFERFCDYTGGLPPDSYSYKFRQQLKSTKDPELKRLFVLLHLYPEVDSSMRDYERGEIRVGKVEYRKMTPQEKESARKELLEKLGDLEAFGLDDPTKEIERHRSKLK